MVARNRQYTDSEVRYNADHTDRNKSGTTDINTGFIILPPWVADKIELAGGDLVDFFYGVDTVGIGDVRPQQDTIGRYPTRKMNDLQPSMVRLSSDGDGTEDISYSDDTAARVQENKERIVNRVRKYLSEEDVADIGFFHYLFSDALHQVNPLSGLCSEYEYEALMPIRNKYMTHTTADGRYCTFGQVRVFNDPESLNGDLTGIPVTNMFSYDVIEGGYYTSQCGLGFEYHKAKGVSLDGICKYAYDRITNICENIPQRVCRSGDVVKVYGDKGSIVCVPDIATVSNVAYMSSRFSADDKGQSAEQLSSAKERMLALIEKIVAERRRWVGTHGAARDGLLVLYTRQL